MEKTSFNPSTIAEHVISHLTDRGMVGKLYTKYSVATHFNPHEVTYRYWVSVLDDLKNAGAENLARYIEKVQNRVESVIDACEELVDLTHQWVSLVKMISSSHV